MKIKLKIIYCCKQCGNQIKWWSALYGSGLCKSCANKGELNRNWLGGKPSCTICGKILSAYNCKTCNKCRNRTQENNPNFVHGHSKCIDCGKILSRYNAIRCKEHNNIFQIGENAGRYIHGTANLPYPLEFNDRLRNKIRMRDNFICQGCGKTQKEQLEKYKTDLEVHHIDYNKANCKESNLITTCKYCNIKANSDRDYWFAYYTYIMEDKTVRRT